MRSCHTIGQAWPRPGMACCQRTFSPESTFQVIGAAVSETPLACGPRNCGQFTVEAARAVWTIKQKHPTKARKEMRGFLFVLIVDPVQHELPSQIHPLLAQP